MFPVASPKQPNKKRRLDLSHKSKAGPSSEILPLVSPNLVSKSSKDPNRGMYPREKVKSKKKLTKIPCPKFSKASKLFRESHHIKCESKSEDTVGDISLSDISIQEDAFPCETLSRCTDPCSSSISQPRCVSVITKVISKTRKSKSSNNIAGKIINFFKPVNSASKFKAPDVTSCSVEAPCASRTRSKSDSSSSNMYNEKFFKTFRDCYGLLGESSSNEDIDESANYFERLPTHVVETILCQLPFTDLMNCCLVCTSWNEIINDRKFVEWKKFYYDLKRRVMNGYLLLDRICATYKLKAVEDGFKVLIKYMGGEYCRRPASDMREHLLKSAKGFDADCVVAERFPEMDEKDSRAWCILTVAMLLSETVWDVYDLYICLLKSQCSLHDITDAMYCVASFVYFFQDKFHINHGIHYRIYYALYMIENNLPSIQLEGIQSLKIMKGLPGQQSIHSYSDSKTMAYLTYEQIRILNHCFQPKQVIRIIALAGTGKTTTLIHLARLYPQVKILNIMYNKAVCEEATRRFPPNVTCRTAHGLAYSYYGRRLQHKLTSKLRPHDLVTMLEHFDGCRLQIHSYARLVLSTIENFCASSAVELTAADVPPFHRGAPETTLSNSVIERIEKDAIKIWRRMVDKDDKNAKITHDVYLKLYQLSKPDFSEFQCIMVDEAQDCNPVMLELVASQNLPVILVGDPFQQIYGFRGAKNAMSLVEATHTYYLTKSFRFGPEIAYIASCCLEVFKRNTRTTLVGNNQPSWTDGRTEGQYAIIARSNVQLFNEAVRLCCLMRFRPNEPNYIAGAFAGGIQSYGFDQLLDIYSLRAQYRRFTGPKHQIADKFIAKFKGMGDLCNYARSVEDTDLLAKIDLVNQHGDKIPDYVKTIKEKCSSSMELANVVFTTAHKAKGLEFDTVCLTDDYQFGTYTDNANGVAAEEETSIVYVAVTRAKRCLLIPEKMMKFLLFTQEKFEYPVSSKKLLMGNPELLCVHCTQTFVPHTVLTLERRRIVTASGRIIRGGPLCMKCGTEPTVRPQVFVDTVIMYLDPTNDFAHRSMNCLVGPLPNDPPIERSAFGVFNAMDVVYVINVNL